MKISLTPKEYRRLLMMLYLGEWMLNGRRADPPTGLRLKCVEVLRTFLGYAVPLGCADLVDSTEGGVLEISDKMEEEPGVREAIDDYDNDAFWQELVSRLAERDYEQIHGRPAQPADREVDVPETSEEREEREAELDRLEASYWTEFEKNGVKNLHILRGVGRPS